MSPTYLPTYLPSWLDERTRQVKSNRQYPCESRRVRSGRLLIETGLILTAEGSGALRGSSTGFPRHNKANGQLDGVQSDCNSRIRLGNLTSTHRATA